MTDHHAVGRKSRNKGKRGELEFARLCISHGYDAHRTAQVMGKTQEAADVTGLPQIHIEVKRTEAFHLWDALAQSKHDSKPGEIPIVAHRRNDCPWVIVMDANDWFTLYDAYNQLCEPVKRSVTDSAE